MRKALGPLLIWLATALPAAGCSPTAPVSLDNADNGRMVPLAAGMEADLTLQTIGGGHYGDPVLSSTSITFLGMSYPPEQNPGGPRQLYRFRAVSPGTAEVSIPHLGGLTETPPFVLTLDVH